MCIRDRYIRLDKGHQQFQSVHKDIEQHRSYRQRTVQGRSHTCLLYTSDFINHQQVHAAYDIDFLLTETEAVA